MSPEEDPIRQAQAAVDAARMLLLAPSLKSINASALQLERVATLLTAVQAGLRVRPAQPGVAKKLANLGHSLGRVALLLENAAAFQAGWSQQLALTLGGYTAAGEPAAQKPHATVSVEG